MNVRNICMATWLLGPAGCVGEGEVEVRVWGEAFIEQGIPADAVADGWAIGFDRFEVELRDVAIAGMTLADPGPLDLSQASAGVGQRVGRASVPEGDHADAEFTLARVSVEGQASKADVTKTFAWEFTTPIRHFECETTTRVPAGGSGELQITIHADHLFHDSLVAEQPALRFEAIAAADLDGDGTIGTAELAASDIGPYDPGNLPIDDLWPFLAAQAATMGHVDGEHHCASSIE
jgi:hypothetical protein